jgi:hypothetical protein
MEHQQLQNSTAERWNHTTRIRRTDDQREMPSSSSTPTHCKRPRLILVGCDQNIYIYCIDQSLSSFCFEVEVTITYWLYSWSTKTTNATRRMTTTQPIRNIHEDEDDYMVTTDEYDHQSSCNPHACCDRWISFQTISFADVRQPYGTRHRK